MWLGGERPFGDEFRGSKGVEEEEAKAGGACVQTRFPPPFFPP